MSNEKNVTLKGEWFVKLYGSDGILKDERQGHNVITTVGKEFVASFLNSAVAAASTFTGRYLAIGTNATAEAVGDTALGTETARHTGTVSYISGGIVQIVGTFGTGVGTGSIVEYGLLSSSSAGTLIARDTESSIAKGANDVLVATVQVTLS